MSKEATIMNEQECQQEITSSLCVCIQCGGQLKPFEVGAPASGNYRGFRPWCSSCRVINDGVLRMIFDISDHLVRNGHYRPVKGAPGTRWPEEGHPNYEKWITWQVANAHKLVSAVIMQGVKQGYLEQKKQW